MFFWLPLYNSYFLFEIFFLVSIFSCSRTLLLSLCLFSSLPSSRPTILLVSSPFFLLWCQFIFFCFFFFYLCTCTEALKEIKKDTTFKPAGRPRYASTCLLACSLSWYVTCEPVSASTVDEQFLYALRSASCMCMFKTVRCFLFMIFLNLRLWIFVYKCLL